MAKRVITIAAALLSLGAVACAQPIRPELPQATAAVLSPVQLISRANEFNGPTVEVQGFYTSNTDNRALWESAAARLDAAERRRGPDFDYWSKCITIYSDRVNLFRYHNRNVRLTGRVTLVQPDELRHLWVCNAVSLEVTWAAPL